MALGSDTGREGLEGDCVDAVSEPVLVDRAGALAESSGRRAPYRGVDLIEHQGRGRRSKQTAGRAEEKVAVP